MELKLKLPSSPAASEWSQRSVDYHSLPADAHCWVSRNGGSSAAFEYVGFCAGRRGSSQEETRAGLGDGGHQQHGALHHTHQVASVLIHAYQYPSISLSKAKLSSCFWVFQGSQELQDPAQSGLPWQHCRPLVSENWNLSVSVRFNHRGGGWSPSQQTSQSEDLENPTQATCSQWFYILIICLCPVTVNRERLLLEYERTGELLVDLGSDQTSLHNPFNGGYYPVQLSFQQANQVMAADPNRFKTMVQERWLI